jgi:phosphopantothenoylcysteine decarboxylase/phosphopantothenate--cysteine ligase
MNSGISRMIRERKDMLKGKNVILGVTGSIAAYKIASLASALKKLSCNVDVIMTENACNFINPITFETLTGNKCLVDTVQRRTCFTCKESRFISCRSCIGEFYRQSSKRYS